MIPGMLVQTPPSAHGSFQQLSYVRAQPLWQVIGQATDALTPDASTAQAMVHCAILWAIL
jgi:hypothetical protein